MKAEDSRISPVIQVVLVTAGLIWAPASAIATEQAEQRREARDMRQDTRQDARETKMDCRAADQKTNPECRQDRRETKREGREAARDIKY